MYGRQVNTQAQHKLSSHADLHFIQGLLVQEHAITGDTTKQDAPQLVVETISPLTRGNVTPEAAGEVLKRLGFWDFHQHLAPLRAGITHDYPPAVEVPPPPPACA